MKTGTESLLYIFLVMTSHSLADLENVLLIGSVFPLGKVLNNCIKQNETLTLDLHG